MEKKPKHCESVSSSGEEDETRRVSKYLPSQSRTSNKDVPPRLLLAVLRPCSSTSTLRPAPALSRSDATGWGFGGEYKVLGVEIGIEQGLTSGGIE